jgi:hypothetical protein
MSEHKLPPDIRAYALQKRTDPKQKEIDRLRTENAAQKFMLAVRHEECVELASLVSRLQTDRDALRGQNERLRDELVAKEEERLILSELVREALYPAHSQWRALWNERAEKVLEETS